MTPTTTLASRSTAALLAVAALASSGCTALVVGGAVVGGALVATDRRTTGTQVDDEVIEQKARARLNEALGERGHIGVISYGRMVLLVGEVEAEPDRQTAEQVIARIDNVQSVVNELRGQIGALAVDLAGRVVGESLEDEARRRGTVDRFLDELDGMSGGTADGRTGSTVFVPGADR